MSVKRKLQLVNLLIQQDDFCPVTDYAKNLHVSSRTVYSYLDELQKTIEKFGCSLEKVPGKGIMLNGETLEKNRLMRFLKAERYSIDLSPEERRFLVLDRLLQGDTMSYNKLAEDFFVSRSTIVKDMKWIKSNYILPEMKIVSNSKGSFLLASERSIQQVMSKYLLTQFESETGHMPMDCKEYSRFFCENYPDCKQLIEEALRQIENMGERFTLANYYKVKLFESLVILLMRVKQGHHLEKEEGYIFERVENLETYFIAEEYAKMFSSKLPVCFALEDILYLNDCFIANGMKALKTSESSTYYESVVESLIQKFSAVLNMDLSQDDKLRKGLMNHLVPMYFRIKQGITLSNPYLNEIKKQYSMVFHLTWFLLVDLEQELNKRIPEDEIGFMMVHFQSALERNRDIKKILIVSQTGLLTSELLEIRVKKALPSIHIYETIAESELANVDLSKVDLILSTVVLKEQNTPVIKMSSIPSEEELQQISHYIVDHFSSKSKLQLGLENRDSKQPLLSYLNKEQVVIHDEGLDSKQIIKLLVNPLEQNGFVNEHYLKSVLDREQMSSTAFDTGVAIPHGNPEYVKKTKISIFVSEKKISWDEEKVDVVILFSVAKDDLSHLSTIIEPIYRVIDSRKQVERVFKDRSIEEIIDYFANS